MQNLLSLHELVKARLHCRAMHEGSVGVRADTRIPPIQSYIFMARPEDLVLYKVMPTRDIVKCSSINMTNARLISNRKHKLPSQHKFSALSCRRADRVDSGRRLLETVCLKRIDTLAATGCDLSTYFRQEASHIHTQHIHTSPIGAHFGNKCAHWCKQRSVQGVH